MAETTFQSQQAALNKSAEDAAKVADKAKQAQEQGVDAREEVKNKQNAEYYERAAAAQPTPTQRENDLAKVGAQNLDEKEDDGSEWEDEAQVRVATEKLNNPYNVRDLSAPESGRTRRGRKGK